MSLEDIRRILLDVNNKVLKIFYELKELADKNEWEEKFMTTVQGRYSWKVRRKFLYNVIRDVCRKKYNSSNNKEKLKDLFIKWVYAKKLLLGFLKINENILDRILRLLEKWHIQKSYPKGIFIWNPSHGEIKKDFVRTFIRNGESVDDAILALDVGYYLRSILRDISPLVLLTILLPCADPGEKDMYIQESKVALKMFMISDYWYSFIEKRESPDYEHWELWKEIIEDLEND